MYEELDVLKETCQRLKKAEIPYMLTGSFAANFYAVPRMTRDIDIVIEIHVSDVDKILEIFQDDFYINKTSIIEAINHQDMFNIIHAESVFKIDFIIRKNETYRDVEFRRKREILLNNTPIYIVAPEDLIISKLFWAKDSLSEMQLKDVKNLFQTIKNLDTGYIDRWVKELNLNHVYERAMLDA